AARVQVLEDREEIRELLLAYGRALDSRDFIAFSELFAEDEGEWIGGLASAHPQRRSGSSSCRATTRARGGSTSATMTIPSCARTAAGDSCVARRSPTFPHRNSTQCVCGARCFRSTYGSR